MLSLFSITLRAPPLPFFFFFNDTATTEIYTLSLHDALPICLQFDVEGKRREQERLLQHLKQSQVFGSVTSLGPVDRKSTRLNSSHSQISYAVFCLKKKKNQRHILQRNIFSVSSQSIEYSVNI